MKLRRHGYYGALAATVLLLGAAIPFRARNVAHEHVLATPQGSRKLATAILLDSLPLLGGVAYSAIVLRQSGPGGEDLILLPKSGISGALLDAATRTLIQARGYQGDNPTSLHGKQFSELEIGVIGRAAGQAWIDRFGARADTVVAHLLAASPQEIAHFGKVQAVKFYPPKINPGLPPSLRHHH
jgi:hypothetical protein